MPRHVSGSTQYFPRLLILWWGIEDCHIHSQRVLHYSQIWSPRSLLSFGSSYTSYTRKPLSSVDMRLSPITLSELGNERYGQWVRCVVELDLFSVIIRSVLYYQLRTIDEKVCLSLDTVDSNHVGFLHAFRSIIFVHFYLAWSGFQRIQLRHL